MLMRSTAPALGFLVGATLVASACSDGSSESAALGWQQAAVSLAGAGGDAAGGAPPTDNGGAGGQTEVGGENTGAAPTCAAQPDGTRVVYDGSESGPCTSSLRAPYAGSWYVSNDGTGTETANAPVGEHGGVDGASDCAMHSTGTGFSGWGGVTLYLDDFPLCPYDLSSFAGVRLKLKGNSHGTEGGCGAQDNVVHLKVGTLATTPEQYQGTCVEPSNPNDPGCWDDFGGFCKLSPDWTTCDVWFSELTQRGWGKPAVFEPSEILTLTFLAQGADLSWDFWVDDLSFIPGSETSPGKGSGNDCSVDHGGSGGTAGTGNGGDAGAAGNSGGTSTGGTTTAGSPSSSGSNVGGSSAGTGTAVGGADAQGGEAAAGSSGSTPNPDSDTGCSCRLEGSAGQSSYGGLALVGLGLALRARRQRRSRGTLPAGGAS